MPVCLGCGRSLERGKRYCGECADRGVERAHLRKPAQGRPLFPGTLGGKRLLVTGMLALCAFMVGVSLVLLAVLPGDPEILNAAGCRANLKRIERAIDRYHHVEREYPPAGRLNSTHPLVYDGYLDRVPRCPATGRVYMIEESGKRVAAVCDSGLEDHLAGKRE